MILNNKLSAWFVKISAVGTLSCLAFKSKKIFAYDNTEVTEPSSGITFPTQLNLFGNNFKLLGHGIRQVTLLRFNAYALGFYMKEADYKKYRGFKDAAENFDKFQKKVLVPSAVALRLVPARHSSGIHLRNAIEKQLSDRVNATINDETKRANVMAEIKDFCSCFPQTISLKTELIFYKSGQEISVIFNGYELKKIKNEFISTELPAVYLRNDMIPELKKGVFNAIRD